jgi:hypothetical protein
MDHKTTTEHRRLAILQFAERSPGYTVSVQMLADLLRGVGIATTMDAVMATAAWLEEMELVELSQPGGVTLVTATARGCDVANGMATHPGVRRPAR